MLSIKEALKNKMKNKIVIRGKVICDEDGNVTIKDDSLQMKVDIQTQKFKGLIRQDKFIKIMQPQIHEERIIITDKTIICPTPAFDIGAENVECTKAC